MLTAEELAKLQRGQLTLHDILHPSGAPLLLQAEAHAEQTMNAMLDSNSDALTPEALDKALADSEATTARLRVAKQILLDSKPKAGASPSSQMTTPPPLSTPPPAAGIAASSTSSTK